MAEIKVVDADVVEQQLAPIIDGALSRAPGLAVSIIDDSSRTAAVDLGVEVKTAISKIEAEREEIYEPLRKGVDRLRDKFDDRIKKGKAILKMLSSGISDYDIKKRREAELEREKREAEARRIQEDADRKRREAEEAERRRVQAVEDEKRRKAEAIVAEERRVQAEKEAKERAERQRREAEQAELDRKRAEEETARLAHAQQAEDSGNGPGRVDNILSSPTPIAPVLASPQLDLDRKALEAQQLLADRASQEKYEKEMVESEAAAKRQEEAEAAALKTAREAEEAEAAAVAATAAATATVFKPTDNRTRKNVTWKWQVRDESSFLRLAKAVVEGRAPVTFLGFDPDKPEKFRPAAIGREVVDQKESFKCDGIETWPHEETNFKVAA